MIQLIWQVVSIILLITVIWHMIAVRKQAKMGKASDSLKGGEKVYVWVVSLIDPVVAGAFFYYGWKKMLPNKAKQANAISLWSFLILIILGAGYYFAFQPTIPTTSNQESISTAQNDANSQTPVVNTSKVNPSVATSVSNTNTSGINKATGWQSVTSSNGNFRISFPTTPTHTTINSTSNSAYSGVPYIRDSYKSSTADARYGFDETKYSSAISDMTATDMARTLLEGMVKSDPNNKLITSTPGKFGSYTSLDFAFSNQKSNFTLKGKILVIDPTDFIVLTVVTTANNTSDDNNYQTFVSSFQLK
jgi:hypothetical protein